MPDFPIEMFGRGADTTRNASLLPVGRARQSINMLHNRGQNRATVRAGSQRVNNDRITGLEDPGLGMYEYLSEIIERIGDSVQKIALLPVLIRGLLTGTGMVKFELFLRYWVMTDNKTVCNWLGNLTTAVPYGVDQPTTAITAVPGAAGTLDGEYKYSYARFNPLTGELSRAVELPVSAFPAFQSVTVNIAGLAAVEQFTHVRLFRTEVNEFAFFDLVDLAISALPYVDNALDETLIDLSIIHDENGAPITSRMEAAFDVCLHRGRLHFINLLGYGSRQRWTLPLSFNSESTTEARHNVEEDDGDDLRRVFSIDGTLALFKDHSIHVMNGDFDQLSFTWQIVSGKEAGIGAWCPWTAVVTPRGIIFMAECGIYLWRPAMDQPLLISDSSQLSEDAPSIAKTIKTANYVRRLFFCAGYNHCERLYLISFATGNSQTNNETWAFSIESATWSEWKRGFDPSVYGQAHNSTENIKLYVADQIGFIYDTDVSGADGPVSGTLTGLITSATSTQINDTLANFYALGDGLLNVPVTVEKPGTGGAPVYETKLITANTATQLTTQPFSALPAPGDIYYVGAITGTLSYGRLDMGSTGDKFFQAINVNMEKLSTTVKLQVGYTIDGDTQPTLFEAFTQSSGFRLSIPVERYGVGISPFFRVIGVNVNFELIRLSVEYIPLGTNMPKVGTHV